jgi:hypothetical protein
MTEEAPTYTPVRLVYAGRRTITGGKPGYWYMTEDGLEGWGGYAKPLVAGQRIGTLLEVQQTKDDRIIVKGPNGPRSIGPADVAPELLTSWQLASDVVELEVARAAAERRIQKEVGKPLDELLEPIRVALNALPWNQRAAAIAVILAKLR